MVEKPSIAPLPYNAWVRRCHNRVRERCVQRGETGSISGADFISFLTAVRLVTMGMSCTPRDKAAIYKSGWSPLLGVGRGNKEAWMCSGTHEGYLYGLC